MTASTLYLRSAATPPTTRGASPGATSQGRPMPRLTIVAGLLLGVYGAGLIVAGGVADGLAAALLIGAGIAELVAMLGLASRATWGGPLAAAVAVAGLIAAFATAFAVLGGADPFAPLGATTRSPANSLAITILVALGYRAILAGALRASGRG